MYIYSYVELLAKNKISFLNKQSNVPEHYMHI